MSVVTPAVPLLTARQRRRLRQGDQVTRLLLASMWAYIVLPSTLQALTGADFHAVSVLALLAVTGGSLVVVAVWFGDLVENRLWLAGVCVAPAVYLAVRELYLGHHDYHLLSYLSVVLAIAAARPRLRALEVLVPLLLATAVVAFAIGLLDPSVGLAHEAGQAGREKGLIPGIGLLAGMFGQENNLGQLLALGLPVLMLVDDVRRRALAIVVVLVPLVWSASRGSIITAVVGLLLMVTLPLVRDRGLRSGLERLAVAACAAVCLWLPFVLRPGDKAFSARGGIWSGSIAEWWAHARLWGLGSDWYQRMMGDTASPIIASATHGHNQAVHWAVTGGLALLVLGGLQWAVATAVLTVPRARHDVLGTVVMAGLCVNGWLEYDWGYLDGVLFWPFTFPVLATLLFCRDRHLRPVRPPIRRPTPQEAT